MALVGRAECRRTPSGGHGRGSINAQSACRVRSHGQRGVGVGECHDARVVDRPSHRWGHPIDVLPAEIEQVPVTLWYEVADQHLSILISKRDGSDRLGVTSHLRAGSHRASLDDTDVISKHLGRSACGQTEIAARSAQTDVPRSGAPVSLRVATGYDSNDSRAARERQPFLPERVTRTSAEERVRATTAFDRRQTLTEAGVSPSTASAGREPMTITLVPTSTIGYSCSISELCMRMQPCDA